MSHRIAYLLLAGYLGAAGLSGCGGIAVGAGAMPAYVRPKYDTPSQVIYRIDDQRYFTIENYEDCSVGGDVYYHDERSGLRTKVRASGMGIWPGRFSIEPADFAIVIPTHSCNRDGYCGLGFNVSTDGGKSFDWFYGWQIGHRVNREDVRRSVENTNIVVKGNEIFAAQTGDDEVSRFVMSPGMSANDVRLTSVLAEAVIRPWQVPSVHTPSGQDRFTCDTNIRPNNLPPKD